MKSELRSQSIPIINIVMMLMKNRVSEEDTGLFRMKFSALCQLSWFYSRGIMFSGRRMTPTVTKLSGKHFFLNICLMCYIHENYFFLTLSYERNSSICHSLPSLHPWPHVENFRKSQVPLKCLPADTKMYLINIASLVYCSFSVQEDSTPRRLLNLFYVLEHLS